MPRQVSETTLEIRRMAKVIRLRAKIEQAESAWREKEIRHQRRMSQLTEELDALGGVMVAE